MTACHWAAYDGRLDVLLQVWEWAEGKLTREYLNSKLLLATDNKGMTACHWAAYDGRLDVLLQVWEWAEGKPAIDEINNKFQLATDNAGMTALHETAFHGKLNVITIKLFFQSRKNAIVRWYRIQRKCGVIKTLQAQGGQFLLDCKCAVSRGIIVQKQDANA